MNSRWHATLPGGAAALLAAVIAALATAPAAAQPPKIIHYARAAQFESLDPPRQFDLSSNELVSMLYSSLLKYSYLERPFRLEPDLIERMPELSADRLTLTFKLRKGIRFRDDKSFPGGKGRELTTDDVLFSLRRFADANVNHKSWFLMEGAVVGLDAYRAATVKAGPKGDSSKLAVEGFRKIDSHSFTIRLTKPNPLFLFALATSATAIHPPEAVATYGDQLAVNTVGTGPFTIDKVDRKGVLRFVKNPNYHGTYPTAGEPGDAEKGLLKDAGKKLPLVDVVEMPLIEEAQPGMLKFLKGELDWRGLDRANFTKMIVRSGDGDWKLNDEFATKFSIYWAPALSTWFTTLNLRDPLLGSNKKLRQALAHLVDTQAEIDLLFNGRGVKLKSIVPLPLPGNERETGATAYTYDVAQAKKLLAEAGFPDGKGLPPLTFNVEGTSADARTRADLTKAKFAAAGVQIKPVFNDVPTFIRNQEGGAFQLSTGAWNADYPDPENFYLLMYSKNGPPGPNYSGFANAAYDKAYEAARHMPHGPERIALLRKMNEIIKEEVPNIIGQNPLRFGITQKWLSNFKRNLLAPEFMYLNVDMALKNKGVP